MRAPYAQFLGYLLLVFAAAISGYAAYVWGGLRWAGIGP